MMMPSSFRQGSGREIPFAVPAGLSDDDGVSYRAGWTGAGGATVNRYRDWIEQARINLAHAERSVDMGDHSWACFTAQQAAEAALKALHGRRGQVAWGNSIRGLCTSLS